MPHIVVKLLPGRPEQEKKRLAGKIANAVMETFGLGEESVSIAMEEIASRDWTAKVYRPDIEAHWDRLYKKPGYKPF